MITFSKLARLISGVFLVLFAYKTYALFSGEDAPLNFNGVTKIIVVNDNGFDFKIETAADSVSDLLKEQKLELSEHDVIIPERETKLYSGSSVEIRRAVKVKILADGKTTEGYVLGKTVRRALSENKIELSRLDKTLPDLEKPVANGLTISVTRISVEEIIEEEKIDFKIIVKNDKELGWREKKVETKGEEGIREVKYKITYKDGKEVSRVTLEKNILKDPVAQVETQGTYMKLGKAARGQGTWYAWKGGMFAASTTLPKGSYAKVTNTANGKTAIVQINDYGPQGKGRIIDLDKVAFAKIASLGAGVIGVKVEPVLN